MKKELEASADEAAGDFLFFLSNPKKFLSVTKPIWDAAPTLDLVSGVRSCPALAYSSVQAKANCPENSL
jgi:hypothetical protein